jgi:hypothetical protein
MMALETLRAGTGLAAILVSGFGLQRLLGPRQKLDPIAERIGLAWILGGGWISVLIAVLGPFLHGNALCLTLLALTAALAAFASQKKHGNNPPPASLTALEWILLGVLVGQAIGIGLSATQFALRWDALATWEWKARFAFANGGSLPSSYFCDPTYDWSHMRYPLQLPYVESWLYLCLGRVDQSWIRLIGPLYYLAGVTTVIGASKRLGTASLTGWCAGTAMFFVPYAFCGIWGMFSGYADLPLGVILVAAISRIPSLAKTEDARLLGLVAALLPWMKREGQALWLVVALLATVQLVRTRRMRDLSWVIAPGALLIVTFDAAMNFVDALPQSDSFTVSFSELPSRLGRMGVIANHLGEKVMDFESWSLLWLGAILATLALLLRRKTSLAGTLGGGLILCWLLLGSAYVLGYPDQFENHIPTTVDRILLQFMPLAMLTIAMAVPRVRAKSKNNACLRGHSTLSEGPRVCPDIYPSSTNPKEIKPVSVSEQ